MSNQNATVERVGWGEVVIDVSDEFREQVEYWAWLYDMSVLDFMRVSLMAGARDFADAVRSK